MQQPMPLSRLRWACRRGMLELDLLFERYINEIYPKLSHQQQQNFEQLLQQSDQDLFDWYIKRSTTPPPQFLAISQQIQQLTSPPHAQHQN